MKQLEHFETEADKLAPTLGRKLGEIKLKNVNGALGAAAMFKQMSDAVDTQVLKLDGLQQTLISPFWGRLSNSEINRVRRIVADVKAAIEAAAEAA